jgi:HPt (histidine-containing phosphotransfer) domain-containing protein
LSGDDEEQLFHRLRLDYLEESGERVAELRADLERLSDGADDAPGALKGKLHRLAGSGGSYGFPEVSAIAREAELWLAGGPPGNEMLPGIRDIVARLEAEFEKAKRR